MLLKPKQRSRTQKKKTGFDNLLNLAERMQFDSRKTDQKVGNKQLSKQSTLYTKDLKNREKDLTQVFDEVAKERNLGQQYIKSFESDLRDDLNFSVQLKKHMLKVREDLRNNQHLVQSTQAKNSDLEIRISEIGRKIEEKEISIAALRKNNDGLSKQLSLEEEQNSTLLGEMKQLQEEYRTEEGKNRANEEKIAQMKKELEKRNRELEEKKKFKNRLDDILSMIMKVEGIGHVANNPNFCKELRENASPLLFHLQHEMGFDTTDLNERMERMIGKEYDIRKLANEIRSLEALRGDYQKRVETTNRDIKALEEELKKEKESCSGLNTKLSELVEKEGFEGKGIDQLEEAVRALQQKVMKKRNESALLSEELARVQRSFEGECNEKKQSLNSIRSVLQNDGNDPSKLKELIKKEQTSVTNGKLFLNKLKEELENKRAETIAKKESVKENIQAQLLEKRKQAAIELENSKRLTKEGMQKLKAKENEHANVRNLVERVGVEGFQNEGTRNELNEWKSNRESYYKELREKEIQKLKEQERYSKKVEVVDDSEDDSVIGLKDLPSMSDGEGSGDDFDIFGGEFDLFGDF